MSKKLPWRRWVARCVTLLTTLTVCAAALARAGGGHGYSGGGGHGGGGGFSGGHGGGGSGGGGGGDLVGLLYWLLWLHPTIGWPLTLIVIAFFIYGGRQGNTVYQSNVIRRGTAAMDRQARDAAIAALQAADPQFDPGVLMRRVAVAFVKIQDAWSNQQIERVRAFISDGVFERFNLQIDEQKSLGFRNLMQDVAVLNTDIAQVFSDRNFDQISIVIEARATDTDIELSTARSIRTNSTEPFTEIWSFIRRRGASTQPGKPGLIEGHCPNCGAPIEMNQNANCAHCQALLRSGEFDWVLAEITQESEWRATEARDLPGVSQLAAHDPDFNAQELEDRTSVIFWRHAAAERLGTAKPLRKIATPEFCATYEDELRGRSADGREYLGECAVGSVELLGVIPGQPIERAIVEVRWAGVRYRIENDCPARGDGRAFYHTAFVLARKSGSVTEINRAISSAHCPNCGAPESKGESDACEFCGAVLNDGSRGWVLVDAMPAGNASPLLRDIPQPATVSGDDGARSVPPPLPSAAGLMAWLVQMSAADGQVVAKELEMLMNVAANHRIPRQEVETMIRAALRNELTAPAPSSIAEAKIWLREMARAALADGTLSRQEDALLRAAGSRAGLVDYDIRLLINDVRSEMYKDAKAALRSNGGHV